MKKINIFAVIEQHSAVLEEIASIALSQVDSYNELERNFNYIEQISQKLI